MNGVTTASTAVASSHAIAERAGGSDIQSRVVRAEAAQIRELASRDREVRAHEQAHASIGGRYASSPSYQFERGPNGVRYAAAGHVSIDVASVPNDPDATIEKMTTVRRAALAPQNPSPADRAVAAKAGRQLAEARAEALAEKAAAVESSAARADEERLNSRQGSNAYHSQPAQIGTIVDIVA